MKCFTTRDIFSWYITENINVADFDKRKVYVKEAA